MAAFESFAPEVPVKVVPVEAVAVVMKAMAKKPMERYSNCRQIALDVHAALFGHVRAS